ncbi:MAG: hypothetical protein C4518_10475 [Desulfobacteraceae bacterium]|nr:MAG: hypothetical protein C4518_10475 [Desulfobacteraceae bacterium]
MDLKDRCRQVISAWNAKDIGALKAIYAQKAIFFDPMVAKEITGDFIIHYAQSIFLAFPDLRFNIQDMAAGQDVVMTQWVQCGTNIGPIMGNPATGRYIEIPAVSVIRFKKDRLTSHHDYWDMVFFLKGLGFM